MVFGKILKLQAINKSLFSQKCVHIDLIWNGFTEDINLRTINVIINEF